ncbi:MAG: glycosyltransferase family 39 protein, partial [Caulobacteraceae bacterium]|nr:glycosyltransferase family 39 protein [Caulobacteraceae bacterium]
MTLQTRVEAWCAGWRGPALAALIALIAGLPGVFAMPPLDRDESRFAQASAQMLQSGDYVVIRFLDEPRFKKPVGIHWLQAASVAALSSPEAREIWAYRIPSLLGAMLAAWACGWGARSFFGDRAGFLAGAILVASMLLSTEAFIAKTDAVLCGLTTLALAALGRLYNQAREGPLAGRPARAFLWLGIAGAALVKGPVGPLVVALALIALVLVDRDRAWVRKLGWGWGLIAILGIVGPWAVAVTVATDGAFWTTAFGGDLAPKLVGGHETHGAPPGLHTLLAPVLLFPATLLLPAALWVGWTRRGEPGVRFALCWLIPGWLMFELLPTKLVHYPLPLYGALAWLMAAALAQPLARWPRWIGAGLAVLVALALAGVVVALLAQFGDAPDVLPAAIAATLLAAAGIAGAVLQLRHRAARGLGAALALGIAGHGVLAASLAPGLSPLWVSQRTVEAMRANTLAPRQGIVASPVAVAGYAEPSLVFGIGAQVNLGGPLDAADAIAEGRPAIVEDRETA